MKPIVFGDDVIDNVDNVIASHVNNLRAWQSVFAPLICNMELTETTDTTMTLSDTDVPFQVVNSKGEAGFTVYLPVESTDNHPFFIANDSTDSSSIDVKTSSSDTIYTVDYGIFISTLSSGTKWFSPPVSG